MSLLSLSFTSRTSLKQTQPKAPFHTQRTLARSLLYHPRLRLHLEQIRHRHRPRPPGHPRHPHHTRMIVHQVRKLVHPKHLPDYPTPSSRPTRQHTHILPTRRPTIPQRLHPQRIHNGRRRRQGRRRRRQGRRRPASRLHTLTVRIPQHPTRQLLLQPTQARPHQPRRHRRTTRVVGIDRRALLYVCVFTALVLLAPTTNPPISTISTSPSRPSCSPRDDPNAPQAERDRDRDEREKGHFRVPAQGMPYNPKIRR